MTSSALSRLLHRLRHARIENKGLKLLSLALAVLLFLLSRQPPTDLQVAGVRIEYRGLRPGVEIVNDGEQTVTVRVKGPRNVTRSLTPNQLLVVADLSNKEPGERIVQLKPDESFMPDDVQIIQIDPASIRIKLELTKTKRVRVEPQFLGHVAKGFERLRFNLTPSEVEIEGPQSMIDNIDHVVTESVNLEGLKASFQTPVDIEVPQDSSRDSLRVKPPNQVTLTVDIGEERALRRFANIPVQWPDKDSSGRLVTKTVDVDVFGPKSLVDAIRPDEVHVEVKTTGLSPDETSVTPLVRFPTQVEKNLEVRNIIPKEVKVKR
jgi:YbbR domain-containing protein